MKEEKWIIFWIGIMVVGMCIAGYFAIQGNIAYAAACEKAGGHLRSLTSYGIGMGPTIGGSGGVAVVPTTSTTTFCLSSDGRILLL